MAVQFVLGRSGTGKTTYCVESIAAALGRGGPGSAPSLLFLVPEQATYEAERAILSAGAVRGYHRLRILSFNRLQFYLIGGGARPSVSHLGRQMLVHKVLRESREQLQVFRSAALLPGLARQLAQTIRELHRYDRRSEDFQTLAEEGQQRGARLSAMKFADLAMVFGRYSEAVEGRFVDPDAQASLACRKIAGTDFLRGARLWIDGFASFTGAELTMLIELLGVVNHAYIALAMDPDRLGQPAGQTDGLFEPTERTYQDLVERIEGCGIKLEKPLVLKKAERFASSPALAHVEKHIFRPGAPRGQAGGGIRVVAANDLRAEAEFVSGEILRLVQEQGHRFRDIAVVASDLGRYEHYIRAYFDDHRIPYFIDQRKPLDRHPVIELVTSALNAAIGGFDHADVFAYLKSDLVPITRREVDVLENYCLAFGVDGRDWVRSEAWQFKGPEDPDFDEGAIDAIRRRAAAPLVELRTALGVGANDPSPLQAIDFTRAVFALLDGLEVRRVVRRWVDEAHEAGDLSTADEHRQFFDLFVEIFDELVKVFERDAMAPSDYLALLNLAFSQMTMAFIPPSLDQVLVGSIERSRHPNLKAVFLLGATQKQFPVPAPSAGVLTDSDRELAEEVGFHVAPTTTQTLAERQYLAYIAFTRPSEFLCISYPGVDEKGAPMARSHFVDELMDLFDDLTVTVPSDGQTTASDIHNDLELAQWLCTRLGRDVFAREERGGAPLEGLLAAMSEDRDRRGTAESVASAIGYRNDATLSPEVVKRLFSGKLQGSATRLATFAACPFKHFARYSLELKPRREFRLEPLDLGNFYHAILDALTRQLASEGKNFADVDEARLLELLSERVRDFTQHDPFISKFQARSEHNAFIIQNAAGVLGECLLDVAQMTRAGAFRPILSEMGFGEAGHAEQNLGAFELALPEGGVVSLTGRIDRIDAAAADGQRVALIFDYKRTEAATKFDWSRFYHGLNVQLPMYLLALSQTGGAGIERVAGGFSVPVEQPPRTATIDELAERAERTTRKAKGLFDGGYADALDPEAGARWSQYYNFAVTSGDGAYGYYRTSGSLKPEDFQRVLAFAKDKIVSLAAGIVAGQIEVRPYRLGTEVACSFCDYRAVCRFDWQINDYHFIDNKGKLDVVGEAMTS